MGFSGRTKFFKAYQSTIDQQIFDKDNPVTELLTQYGEHLAYSKISDGELEERQKVTEFNPQEFMEEETGFEDAYLSLDYNNGRLRIDLRILEDSVEEFKPEETENYVRIHGFNDSNQTLNETITKNRNENTYLAEILDNLR